MSNYGCRFSCSSLEINPQVAKVGNTAFIILEKNERGSYCANNNNNNNKLFILQKIDQLSMKKQLV